MESKTTEIQKLQEQFTELKEQKEELDEFLLRRVQFYTEREYLLIDAERTIKKQKMKISFLNQKCLELQEANKDLINQKSKENNNQFEGLFTQQDYAYELNLKDEIIKENETIKQKLCLLMEDNCVEICSTQNQQLVIDDLQAQIHENNQNYFQSLEQNKQIQQVYQQQVHELLVLNLDLQKQLTQNQNTLQKQIEDIKVINIRLDQLFLDSNGQPFLKKRVGKHLYRFSLIDF